MRATFDSEILPNYALFAFMTEAGEVTKIDIKGKGSTLSKKAREELLRCLKRGTVITFNGINYDMVVTAAALGGCTAYELYEISHRIIVDRVRPWRIYGGRIKELTWCDHVDIMETAPDVKVGLKLYGGRLFSKRLWEYEVDWDKPVTKSQRKGLKKYCTNDLILTWDLFRKIEPSIVLREIMGEEFGLDLRSKSDAQVAEAVIVSELGGASKAPMPKQLSYIAPEWLKFETKELKELHKKLTSTVFKVNPNNGKPVAPDWLKNTIIRLGEAQFQVGLGGLHSTESSMTIKSDENNVMRNADVASFYPWIILNSGLFPPHLGEAFLKIYKKIVKTRLKAKAKGDKGTAETYKIVINGSFGKLGSHYSKLYAPDLMLAVTFTGQLALLMLIEQLELAGVPVVSANTDGVEYFCPRKRVSAALKIIQKWEATTGYTMEHAEYVSLHARDVNNYVAKYDDHVKSKGAYKAMDDMPILKKNPQVPICYTAVREFINSGKPIEKTIRECKDVSQFCSVRVVNGGAMYKGELVGKTVRWYYNKSGHAMHYVKANATGTHNKVPLTDDCTPMMTLKKKVPKDLDYQWYIDYAYSALKDLG